MDLDVAEQDTSDLLRAVQTQLREREHGSVMRLEVESNMDEELADHLIKTLQVPESMVYRINGPIDLTFLKKLPGAIEDHEDLRFRPFSSFHRLQLQMPKEFDAICYYGRGPVENYIDRNSSEFIGVYENKVSNEYFPYIRPQESGNHTDVRWFRVVNAEGNGLEFYSNAPMEASALKYLTEDLDDGAVKDKKFGRHSGDLVERPQTQVHIQQRQMGLGCVNSWGAWPRKEYLMEYKDYDFTFAIRPVKK
jgi:hypothetical protein